MPENKDPQSREEEQTADQKQTGVTQNPQAEKPGQGSSRSDGGQATGTQRQPDQDPSDVSGEQGQVADEDITGQQNQSDDEERTGGQSKQPGLPESNNEPWSPASSNSDR